MKSTASWKLATIVVVAYLTLSVAPEVRIFGLFVDALGLEALFVLLAAQAFAILTEAYHQKLKPLFVRLNIKLENIDSFYFIPTTRQILKCPQVIFHGVPFLIGACVVASAFLSVSL